MTNTLGRVQAAIAVGVLVAMLLQACQRNPEPASTPLPTRQTTIDPVQKKLEKAAENIERRREAVDDAAK